MASNRTSRTRALFLGAATVAVLAVVLIVLGLFGPLHHASVTSDGVSSVTPSETSDELYQAALSAQSSGDLTKTVELAQSAVAADPNNAGAKALLASAKSAQAGATTNSNGNNSGNNSSTNATSTNNGNPNQSSSTTTTGATDPAFLKRYANLNALISTQTPGFAFDVPSQLNRALTMSGRPNPSMLAIPQILWTVNDMGSVSAARSFVSKTSKKLFPRNAATVTVHGVPGYFGTDGTRFATVSYAKGRYTFEVLVTVNGVAPSTVKDTAVKAAAVFRQTPATK